LVRNLELPTAPDRENLTIILKKRMSARTEVIEDESTGETLKLEDVKFGLHHMNDLLNEIDQEEHDAAEAESEARIERGEAEEARLASEGFRRTRQRSPGVLALAGSAIDRECDG